MIYVDSCAMVRLILGEPGAPALRAFLTSHRDQPLVSSALLGVEVVRSVARAAPDLAEEITEALRPVSQLAVTNDLLAAASTIGAPTVRTLDAIHLATANKVRGDLSHLVTYDKRMADAAAGLGLPVASPN